MHIMFNNFFFFPANRVVYEIMSKIMVEPERPQMTMWRRVACRISKATRAQLHARARTEVCYCFSTATVMLRYMYMASPVYNAHLKCAFAG
jgi:hypothetical protein